MDQLKFMLGQMLGRQEAMDRRLEETAMHIRDIHERQHTVMIWSERIGHTLSNLTSSVMELQKGNRAMRRRMEKVEQAPRLDQIIKYVLSTIIIGGMLLKASSPDDLAEVLKALLGLK